MRVTRRHLAIAVAGVLGSSELSLAQGTDPNLLICTASTASTVQPTLPVHLLEQRHALVAQRGTTLEFFPEPTTHDLRKTLGTAVTNVCVLAGAADDGSDLIVFIDGSTLHTADLAIHTGVLSERSHATPSVSSTHLVRAIRLANQTRDDLLVCDVATRTLSVYRWDSNATQFNAIATHVMVLPGNAGTVRDMVALDWDGLATTDDVIGMLTSFGIEIWDVDTAIAVRRLASAIPFELIAKLNLVTGNDGVAFVKPVAGQQRLYFSTIASSDAVTGKIQTATATAPAIALVPGDIDGDGDDDLAIAFSNSQKIHLVTNATTGPGVPAFSHYDASSSGTFFTVAPDPALGTTANSSAPALAPLFNTWLNGAVVADLAMPYDAAGKIRLREATPPNLETVEIFPTEPAYLFDSITNDPVFANPTFYPGLGTNGVGAFRIEVKNAWTEFANQTHLEVFLWKQNDDTQTSLGMLQSSALSRTQFSIGPSGQNPAVPYPVAIQIDIPETPTPTEFTFLTRYYLEVRAIRKNGNVIDRAGKSYFVALSMDPREPPEFTSSNIDFFLSIPGATQGKLMPWTLGCGEEFLILTAPHPALIEPVLVGEEPKVGGIPVTGTLVSTGVVPQARLPSDPSLPPLAYPPVAVPKPANPPTPCGTP